jgi:hypothetical protein
VVCVFVPEYVVARWWEQLLHNQSALRLKSRLLFQPGVMVTSVPYLLLPDEPHPEGPAAPSGPVPVAGEPDLPPVDDLVPEDMRRSASTPRDLVQQ